MKIQFLVFAIIALHTSVNAQTQKSAAVKPAVVKNGLKNATDSFSYAIGYNIATNIRAQGIEQVNLDVLKRAMDEVYKNKTAALTPEVISAVMQKQMAAFQQKASDAEVTRGRNFLEANKKKKGITVLPSGLQYEILVKNDSATNRPTLNDTVVVNYAGTLINGKEFENSFKQGAPATFTLNGVIAGWTEALQLMKVGERWKVYIPMELAYGLYPRDPRVTPPGAALIFEMQLEAIKPLLKQ
jgi:FKBP-type peptidyl-prolyl cis-trans isomerase FklB